LGHTKLSIHRLFPLFQRLENGDIRMPAFQRSFSWRKPQILNLLESVYNGYPIGSLLFWETYEKVLEAAINEFLPSPDLPQRPTKPVSYPTTYVIDGVQRLSCLHNCLRWKEIDTPDRFNVVFDLDTKRFAHYGSGVMNYPFVHLSSVFYPQAAEQRLFDVDASHHPTFLEAVTRLRARFIDYEIPVTTLTEYDLDEVISIFQRLNTTGISLTREDIRRAEAEREHH
jgi:hypothetical protein